MTIVRVKHTKENPYVLINREALWDTSLSLQAVGLWARLLSRPNDWKFYTTELAKSCDVSIETINKYINELIENGYAARAQCRSSDEEGKYPNRFGKWEYWVFEEKQSKEQISNILSETGFSAPITSAPIEPALLSNDSKQNIEKEVVCYPPSVREDLIPPVLCKVGMNGKIIEAKLQEIFLESIREKKNWTTEEITQSWIILRDYKGPIREVFAFIEGTIKKLRNKKKSEFLSNQKESLCQAIQKPTSIPSKKISLADVTPERPSLQSLLEREGLA